MSTLLNRSNEGTSEKQSGLNVLLLGLAFRLNCIESSVRHPELPVTLSRGHLSAFQHSEGNMIKLRKSAHQFGPKLHGDWTIESRIHLLPGSRVGERRGPSWTGLHRDTKT